MARVPEFGEAETREAIAAAEPRLPEVVQDAGQGALGAAARSAPT